MSAPILMPTVVRRVTDDLRSIRDGLIADRADRDLVPGITYVETAEWLPLEMPCGSTVIETPVIGTTVTDSPILSTPQSSAVEELPSNLPRRSRNRRNRQAS